MDMQEHLVDLILYSYLDEDWEQDYHVCFICGQILDGEEEICDVCEMTFP